MGNGYSYEVVPPPALGDEAWEMAARLLGYGSGPDRTMVVHTAPISAEELPGLVGTRVTVTVSWVGDSRRPGVAGLPGASLFLEEQEGAKSHAVFSTDTAREAWVSRLAEDIEVFGPGLVIGLTWNARTSEVREVCDRLPNSMHCVLWDCDFPLDMGGDSGVALALNCQGLNANELAPGEFHVYAMVSRDWESPDAEIARQIGLQLGIGFEPRPYSW